MFLEKIIKIQKKQVLESGKRDGILWKCYWNIQISIINCISVNSPSRKWRKTTCQVYFN